MWQLMTWSLNSLLLQNPKIQYHAHTNMPLNSISSYEPAETSAHPLLHPC
jgi:hypothetical protein